MSEPAVDLLAMGRRLAMFAQNGSHYASDDYERERWEAVRLDAAALLSTATGVEATAITATLDGDQGHATAKVDVRGVLVDDDRVLLVREASDGRWCLPGGWAEPDTSPAEAVRKECREEAGHDVAVERLVGCFDRDRTVGAVPYPFRVYKLFFACRQLGSWERGSTTAERETTDVEWFAFDDLPPLSVARTSEEQLHRVRRVLADPTSGPAFD